MRVGAARLAARLRFSQTPPPTSVPRHNRKSPGDCATESVIPTLWVRGRCAGMIVRRPHLPTMACCFAVVQPVGTKYKIAFFNSNSIRTTLPHSPAGVFDAQTTKLILLTKLHNCMAMSHYCAPWNRLFFLPRKDAIEQLIKKFPREKQHRNPDQITKKSIFSLSKGETYPQAGDSNAAPSFELNVDEDFWKFYCSPGSLSKWIQTLENTISTYRIIVSINEQFSSSTPKGNQTSSTGAKDITSVPESKKMIVVNATYGKLGDPKKSIDVTKQIQGFINQQGGCQLQLNAGSKKNSFWGY